MGFKLALLEYLHMVTANDNELKVRYFYKCARYKHS